MQDPQYEPMKPNTIEKLTERHALTAEDVQNHYSKLIRGTAHNLNNILTIFQGYLSILEMESDGNEMLSEAIQHMQGGADAASVLIQDVLSVCGRVNLVVQELNLTSFVDSLNPYFENRFSGEITIEISRSDELPVIQTDSKQLREVLLILVSNSCQSIEGDGLVKIHFKPVQDGVSITVEDSGCGIGSEELPHIFEPFYTTRKAKKQPGLGLPKLLGILSKLGGSIQVSSETGMGTTAEITLPLAPPSQS